MKTLTFKFEPAVGYAHKYIAIAYDAANPLVALGQVEMDPPFGSEVTGIIPSLPDKDQYLVKVNSVFGCEVGRFVITTGIFTSVRSGSFTRNNCADGSSSTTAVTFSKTYTSAVSQVEANAAAAADTTNFNTLGQAYANEVGVCSMAITAVPITYYSFDADGNGSTHNNFDFMAESGDNASNYSYFYKNPVTGHVIFSLYFNFMGVDMPSFGFAVFAKINNPAHYPIANVVLTGTGRNGQALKGFIDTNGNIGIDQVTGDAVQPYDPLNPLLNVMKLENKTYQSEFEALGLIIP